MLYGAIEAGGTKMICAVGDENGYIVDKTVISTTTPDETMPKVIDYFRDKDIEALGIACFGPIDLDKTSDTYGYIVETPKTAWRFFNIVGTMKDALGVPIGFDTDVNGSLLGEVTWGSAKGLTDAIYITFGTGVGAGILSGGKLVHGMMHPEAGHIKLVPLPGDTFQGICPFHGTCLEGMTSGPAIRARWGLSGEELADRPEVWEMESSYIAQGLSSLICVLSPQKIILGGGVMHRESLFPMIREKVLKELNGYLKTKQLDDIDNYIVPAGLNDDQGIMGALKLAIDSIE
ncbi:MAG: ROK family protein [Eubacterium sp.]|nr:ROK family protein [Eubacterium sp.]